MSRTILGGSVALSLALLAGRLTGLLRELGLASVFGVSPNADLAVLLLTLPDLLVNLLISGGISAALVPRFSALRPDQAMALFRRVSAAVLLVFGLAGLGLLAWPRAVFFVFAPGVDPTLADSGTFAAVALALPLTGVAGVAGAYLNAQQRFFAVGCGTLFFNTGVLAALGFARNSVDPLALLGLGIAGGAALRLAAQTFLLPRRAWTARAEGTLVDRALARAFALATLAAGLTLLAPIVVRAIASTMGPGAIASFNYAQKLVELPVTILITSISTVALSRLSALHAQSKHDDAIASALRDTRYAILVGLTVLLFGAWFSDTIVHIVFSRGKIDEVALARITMLTMIAMLGVPWVALSNMATALLNATGQVNRVFNVTAASLLLLPLLALPGLLLKSENALMLSVVGFQAVSALWLARLAGLPLLGPNAVLGSLMSPHFAAVLALALLCIGADAALGLRSHWLRLALMSGGFVIAMALPVRRFLQFSMTPLPTSAT